GNSEREFSTQDIPICDPHVMFYVGVNRKPKETKDYVHFSTECAEYNSVTGSSNIRMEMTILYLSQSIWVKYLEVVGANIKVRTKYIISGNVKFSDSGKMMVEATNIDYVKGLEFNYNTSENLSSSKTNTRSIINFIADDVDSTSPQIKKPKFSAFSREDDNITAPVVCETIKITIDIEEEYGSSSESKKSLNHIDLETIDDYQEMKFDQDNKFMRESSEDHTQDEKHTEESQAKSGTRSTRSSKKKKRKNVKRK
ncbi:6205_t:CDS:1, partial [Racocetra persica]